VLTHLNTNLTRLFDLGGHGSLALLFANRLAIAWRSASTLANCWQPG